MHKLLLFGETTKRLAFRKFDDSDFDAWIPFHRDPRSSQYWNDLPQDPIQACTEQFMMLIERYKNECVS